MTLPEVVANIRHAKKLFSDTDHYDREFDRKIDSLLDPVVAFAKTQHHLTTKSFIQKMPICKQKVQLRKLRETYKKLDKHQQNISEKALKAFTLSCATDPDNHPIAAS